MIEVVYQGETVAACASVNEAQAVLDQLQQDGLTADDLSLSERSVQSHTMAAIGQHIYHHYPLIKQSQDEKWVTAYQFRLSAAGVPEGSKTLMLFLAGKHPQTLQQWVATNRWLKNRQRHWRLWINYCESGDALPGQRPV